MTMAFCVLTIVAALITAGTCTLNGPVKGDKDSRHLTSNAAYYLESYDKPEFAFGFNYDGADVFLTWKRRRFTIQVPGVNRELGTLSLKSTDRADFYVTYNEPQGLVLMSREQHGDKTVEEFENDATFVARDNLFHDGYAAFEIYSHEGYFIVHTDCSGWSNCLDVFNYFNNSLDNFGDQASFRRKEGPYVIESYDYDQHYLGINGKLECTLARDPHYWYLVHPSLSQDEGSISLQSATHVQGYLRHNFNSSMTIEQCPADTCSYDKEFIDHASFQIEKDAFFEGYFALVAHNSEYTRHMDYAMVIDEINDWDPQAKMSASWRTLQGPYYLEPVGYQGLAITWTNKTKYVFLDRESTRLVYVYPGLTREGGTVSIQLADRNYRDTYLRYDLETHKLVLDEEDRTNPYYREDATFWLQEDAFAVNTIALESYRRRGHYIMRYGNEIKVDIPTNNHDAAFYQVEIF